MRFTSMKVNELIVFIIVSLSLSNSIFTQTDSLGYSGFKWTVGVAYSFHYNSPVNLIRCAEGCMALEQKGNVSPNIELSYYGLFNHISNLGLGIGFYLPRWRERGLVDDGDGSSYSPYDMVASMSIMNFNFGYFIPIKVRDTKNIYLRPEIGFDMNIEYNDLRRRGVSGKFIVGYFIPSRKKRNLAIEAFFKSGMMDYNIWSQRTDYIPYAIGAQLTISSEMLFS